MPLNFGSQKLVRIDLPAPGEWVEVREALGRNDEREIARRYSNLHRLHPDERGGLTSEFLAGDAVEQMEFTMMELAIKRWSFPYAVTPPYIRALDDASVQCIKDRLEELYPSALTEEERKNALTPLATPSPTAEPSPQASDGSA